MIKRYCDICGELLKDHEGATEVSRKLGRVEVRIQRAVDNAWNKGDCCHKCIITAVNKGKIVPNKFN